MEPTTLVKPPVFDDARQERIEKIIGELLVELGHENDPHTKDTPKRMAKMYREVLDGPFRDKSRLMSRMTTFEEKSYSGVVFVQSQFYAFCAHHMALFRGKFGIAYIPYDNKVLGLSKLIRIFREGCRTMTTQEVVTAKAVNLVREVTGSPDVACITRAAHSCMECRGVQAHGSDTVTMVGTGRFEPGTPTRAEFIQHFYAGAK